MNPQEAARLEGHGSGHRSLMRGSTGGRHCLRRAYGDDEPIPAHHCGRRVLTSAPVAMRSVTSAAGARSSGRTRPPLDLPDLDPHQRITLLRRSTMLAQHLLQSMAKTMCAMRRVPIENSSPMGERATTWFVGWIRAVLEEIDCHRTGREHLVAMCVRAHSYNTCRPRLLRNRGRPPIRCSRCRRSSSAHRITGWSTYRRGSG